MQAKGTKVNHKDSIILNCTTQVGGASTPSPSVSSIFVEFSAMHTCFQQSK